MSLVSDYSFPDRVFRASCDASHTPLGRLSTKNTDSSPNMKVQVLS